jgi:hypothetical protein
MSRLVVAKRLGTGSVGLILVVPVLVARLSLWKLQTVFVVDVYDPSLNTA